MSLRRLTVILILALTISGLAGAGCAGQPAAAPVDKPADTQQPGKTSPQLTQPPATGTDNATTTGTQQPSSVKIKSAEKLVFCSGTNDPGGALIYTCNINGSNWIKLSGNHKGADLFPKWSSDGSKIVFFSDRDGDYYQIYSMNSDGSNQTRLTRSDEEDTHPEWSPDGNKIAFTSRRVNGVDHIFIMNADGSGVRQLTSGDNEDGAPAWSPDGSRIAFQGRRGNNVDIFIINAGGSGITKLTDNNQIDAFPEWSPDGKKIVYHSNANGNFEIYVINADGSKPIRLTEATYDNKYPEWSPDGSKIVFYSKRDCTNDNGEIYIMDADGKNQVRVTRSDCTDAGPASWR
jgi:Tol biopolymer transport system component